MEIVFRKDENLLRQLFVESKLIK